ncbi:MULTISPECIES: CaiB/BaiF CoA transferase family protein [Pseudooceanicola]|uniref:CaiB/BaiF CoA transferase family protein n=1 Tax=Pseudooceanicola TaxID=1679449 RepID=UPI0035170EE2
MAIESQLPLNGLQVIKLGAMITAPLATSILAEVIKVERPEGDPFQAFTGGTYAAHFRAHNKGKASVTLDLSVEPGRAELARLLATAGALLENFRPGVLDRLGFPEDRIARDFPDLVYCSITGFGAGGPYLTRPAYDTVALALSGIAHLKVDPAEPGLSGPTLSDNVTGMFAAHGILAALLGRERGRAARRVEVNMLEASIAFTPDSFAMDDEGYEVDRLTRARASQNYALTTADRKVLMIHLSSAVKFWHALLKAVDDASLSADPRFATRQDRYENYVPLQTALAGIFRNRTLEAWRLRLTDNDVPVSPALAIAEVPLNEQVRHLGTLGEIAALDGRACRVINSPSRLDGIRPPVRRAPPLLGEDNDIVTGASETGRRGSKG